MWLHRIKMIGCSAEFRFLCRWRSVRSLGTSIRAWRGLVRRRLSSMPRFQLYIFKSRSKQRSTWMSTSCNVSHDVWRVHLWNSNAYSENSGPLIMHSPMTAYDEVMRSMRSTRSIRSKFYFPQVEIVDLQWYPVYWDVFFGKHFSSAELLLQLNYSSLSHIIFRRIRRNMITLPKCSKCCRGSPSYTMLVIYTTFFRLLVVKNVYIIASTSHVEN